MASDSRPPQRQLDVLLTLHNGERSFGMSLAQKIPAIGPKYTVVSSVFAGSPADRAGVRTGYVVRSINDTPMNGLTVGQVASHFRNASQAKITLEVVGTAASPRTSAFTAQATFGGLATLSNKSAGPPASVSAGTDQRTATPVTGFSAVSSGRAIAAPGTALSVPSVAAPKQPVLRLGAKPAAKTLAAAGAASSTTASLASLSTATRMNGSLAMPTADPKSRSGATRDGLKSKAMAPVLRLGPKPKPVQTTAAAELVNGSAKQVDLVLQAKSAPAKPINAAPVPMENGSASHKTAQSSVSVSSSSSAQATPAQATSVTTTARVTPKPIPTASGVAVAAVSSAPNVTSAPAAKATAPFSAAPTKKLVSGPGSHPVAIPAASVVPTPVASSASTQPSTVTPASVSQRKTAPVSSTAQVPVAKPASTVTSSAGPAKTSSQAPAIPSSVHVPNSLPTSVQKPATTSPKLAPPKPSRVIVAPPTHPPEPAEVTARRRGPPPVVVPKPQAMNRIPPPVPTPVRTTTTVSRSAPAPAAAATSTTPKTKTGKKRGRPRKNPEASNGTPSRKGKGKVKAKRAQPREESDEELDGDMGDEELSALYPFYSFSDEEELPSPKKGRRRGVTDRPRHSLTVERLIRMGFTKEDAEASVVEIGDDPEKCMLWIISKIEERQFTADLNQASIQSEKSKRDEEKRVKEMQRETLAQVEEFMTIFPTSYIAGADSSASRLKKVLESAINQVSAESKLRKVLTDLLTLEGKSIRWYKQAARSYMLGLAERLETALGAHDVVTCCGTCTSSATCGFVETIEEEVKALTKALYEMPTNQGGVPPVFLECDETTKFDLDDDGFEVIE